MYAEGFEGEEVSREGETLRVREEEKMRKGDGASVRI